MHYHIVILGHSMFKNFILIEALLQNPIVHVFLNKLTETTSDIVYKRKSIRLDETSLMLQPTTTTICYTKRSKILVIFKYKIIDCLLNFIVFRFTHKNFGNTKPIF